MLQKFNEKNRDLLININGKLLHRVQMGEKGDDLTRASVAIAHGRLFIRTNSRLFCIGKS